MGSSPGHLLSTLDQNFTLELRPGSGQKDPGPNADEPEAYGREIYKTLSVNCGQPEVRDLWALRIMDSALIHFKVANVRHAYLNLGGGRVETIDDPDAPGLALGSALVGPLPLGLDSEIILTCLGPSELVTESFILSNEDRCLTLGLFYSLIKINGPEGREECTYELDWILNNSGFEDRSIKLSAPGYEPLAAQGLAGHQMWTNPGPPRPLIFSGRTQSGRRVETEINPFVWEVAD